MITMNLKKFLKPNQKKISLFLILIVVSVIVLYVSFKVSGYIPLMCDPIPCSNLTSLFIILYENSIWFALLIILEYAISCWLSERK